MSPKDFIPLASYGLWRRKWLPNLPSWRRSFYDKRMPAAISRDGDKSTPEQKLIDRSPQRKQEAKSTLKTS